MLGWEETASNYIILQYTLNRSTLKALIDDNDQFSAATTYCDCQDWMKKTWPLSLPLPPHSPFLEEQGNRDTRDMCHFYVQPICPGNLCETYDHTSTLLSLLLLQSCIDTPHTLPPHSTPPQAHRALCLVPGQNFHAH